MVEPVSRGVRRGQLHSTHYGAAHGAWRASLFQGKRYVKVGEVSHRKGTV
jgi:hypothetical protein